MKRNRHFITIFFALIFSIVFFTSGRAQNLDCSIQGAVDYYGSLGYTQVDNLTISSNVTNLTPLSTITTVTGNLTIYYTNVITDLNGLNISSVGGNININQNAALTNLAGLENLTSVGGDIYISYNSSLTNLEALESLAAVNNIWIGASPGLTNLSGLESLTSVSGDIEIGGNAALTNLVGLQNLTSVGGYLSISMNDALTNLEGLEGLTTITGNLYISNNHVLTDLHGLENLAKINGKVDIQASLSLKNVDGLASLSAVGGNLQLMNCAALENLNGLQSLRSVGGEMWIALNPQLTSFCGLYPLFTTGTFGYVTIFSNGILFPSPPGEVEQIIALGPCAPDVTVVAVDIYPGTCPNEFNVKGKGAISVAILGTDGFDVQNIDPTTLLLEGISPLRWSVEDVATPVSNGEQCDCTIDGPDGFVDLTLKFDAKSLIAALGEVNNDDELSLTMTGNLSDGTVFEGSDCVSIAGVKLGKDLDGNLSNVPEEYALFENYPNPFNPSTTIKYSIPNTEFVSIKVYDVIGNELTTLVNKEQPAGNYEVRFDASSLSSGIYLYKITSGSFIQTKKMLLLK